MVNGDNTTICTDQDELLSAIEEEPEIKSKKLPIIFEVENFTTHLNIVDRLAAQSRYNVLKITSGEIRNIIINNSDTEKVLLLLDEVVDAFTNPDKLNRINFIDNETAKNTIIEWLLSLKKYFGKHVLIDAEVILLPISAFENLDIEYQIMYFEDTMSKVRKWFKILRKKLKPFISL